VRKVSWAACVIFDTSKTRIRMPRSLKSIRVIRWIRGPFEDESAGKQTTNDSNCTNGCRMCCVTGENCPEPPEDITSGISASSLADVQCGLWPSEVLAHCGYVSCDQGYTGFCSTVTSSRNFTSSPMRIVPGSTTIVVMPPCPRMAE